MPAQVGGRSPLPDRPGGGGPPKDPTTMPKPLDPAKRARIEQAIRDGAGTRSAGSIAREFGVAVSTVTRIAKQAEPGQPFERSNLVNATRARVVDMAAARAALAERWLHKANEALDRSEAPCTVYSFSGQTGEYSEHELPRPPAGDYRSFVTAAAVATDKLLALTKFDAQDETGAAAVDTWLRHVLGRD